MPGKRPEGFDNPATIWRPRTAKKNEDGYGRYLSWLFRERMWVENDTVVQRVSCERVGNYVAYLTSFLAPASVGLTVGALNSAVQAFAPGAQRGWLSLRASRLKKKGKPSRDKWHTIQHTVDLYRYGKELMDNAQEGRGGPISAA